VERADGDVVNETEANTKGSLGVRFRRVCRGPRTWHAWRGASGTWEAPTAPVMKMAGRFIQSEKRMADGGEGVGSAHSTLRAGEPSTWGRG